VAGQVPSTPEGYGEHSFRILIKYLKLDEDLTEDRNDSEKDRITEGEQFKRNRSPEHPAKTSWKADPEKEYGDK